METFVKTSQKRGRPKKTYKILEKLNDDLQQQQQSIVETQTPDPTIVEKTNQFQLSTEQIDTICDFQKNTQLNQLFKHLKKNNFDNKITDLETNKPITLSSFLYAFFSEHLNTYQHFNFIIQHENHQYIFGVKLSDNSIQNLYCIQ